jgi:hypothetical protein
MGASTNGPLMLNESSLLWGLLAITLVPHACIVATGKARPSLLGHHSSDEIVVVGYLPIATDGCGPLVQRRIVVVCAGFISSLPTCLG